MTEPSAASSGALGPERVVGSSEMAGAEPGRVLPGRDGVGADITLCIDRLSRKWILAGLLSCGLTTQRVAYDLGVGQIRVECERWLGMGRPYSVQVDGQEVGRLGRRSKSVTVEVAAGEHTVVVGFNSQTTPVTNVNVDADESARFELAFPPVGKAVGGVLAKPLSEKVRPPSRIGESDLMWLVRF